jgi:hypothetical protein
MSRQVPHLKGFTDERLYYFAQNKPRTSNIVNRTSSVVHRQSYIVSRHSHLK